MDASKHCFIIYIFTYMYVCIYIHIHMFVCVCVYLYKYTHTHMFVCVCVYIFIYLYIYIHTHTHTQTHTCLCVSVCVCVCVPTPKCVSLCFVSYHNKFVIHLIVGSHLTLFARFPPSVFSSYSHSDWVSPDLQMTYFNTYGARWGQLRLIVSKHI